MSSAGDHRFEMNQAVIGKGPITARGRIDREEYEPVAMNVGIIQVTKGSKDPNGNEDYVLVAGAYGMGVPKLKDSAVPDENATWTMRLELDEDDDHRNFNGDSDRFTFGFVLVQLQGGGSTGWIDQVKAVVQEPSGDES